MVARIIVSPFTCNLKLLLTLFIIAAAPFVIADVDSLINRGQFFYTSGRSAAIYADYFLEFYLAVLVYGCINLRWKKCAKFFKWTILSLVTLLGVLNLACLSAINTEFTEESVYLIRQTDPVEASEFWPHYFPISKWLTLAFYVSAIAGLIFAVRILARKISSSAHRSIRYATIIGGDNSLCFSVFNPTVKQ